MIENTTRLENIKRGLGISTHLNWVNNISKKEDTQSNIITSFPIKKSSKKCSLFLDSQIDTIHKTLAKSFHITINNLNGFEKISINNFGHCDITIDVLHSQEGKLFVELNDMSSHELLTSGLTITGHENTSFQIATNITHQKNKLHVSNHRCVTKKNSNIVWFTQSFGTQQVVLNLKADLLGEYSSIKTISTIKGDKGDCFDISTSSHHAAKHTSSDILFQSALESVHVLIRGLVRIEENAAKSQGYQKSNILLLDKAAKAITIPNLEIENKDVMCSHGSSITNINKEKLFYLQSRGVSFNNAKKMIIDGFITSIYKSISNQLRIALQGEKYEK